jgi:hypothetical protein
VTALVANIVFRAFAPWIEMIALGCDFVAFSAFQIRSAAWWLIAIAFLTANVVSAIVGFPLWLRHNRHR